MRSRYVSPIILMSVVLMCILYACTDMGKDLTPQPTSMSVDSAAVHIHKGSSRQVTVSGGIQPYAVKTHPNISIASASISSSQLTISAVDTGNTFLVVNDASAPVPDTARISISVLAASISPSVHYQAQIQPIFDSRCVAGCHGSSGSLSLASGSSYGNLVNVQARSSCTGSKRVSPGVPANSVLYVKITGNACGTRMPQGGLLPSGDISLITTWITEGAPNN
jgi:hypothetical protein